jgi:type VI protein secretion system component Hcp
MPIFLKVPNIKGTVHDAGPDFNDCILIESCDIEVTREVTEGTGAAKNREFRAPTLSAINLNKKIDDASGDVAKWSVGGGAPGDALLYMVKQGGLNGYVPFMKFTMAAPILSKYSISVDDSPEEKGTEEMSISFLSIKIEFFEFDSAGGESPTKKSEGGYDLRTGKAGFVSTKL